MKTPNRSLTGLWPYLTVIILCSTTALLPATLAAQGFLAEPEGIGFDSVNNRYLVSNWADGSITEIDVLSGLRKYFKTGLGNCSGILIHNNTVYVACNNRNLMGFDLTTGDEIMNITLATRGLHGIAADTSGYLYAADWADSRIYRVNISDQSFSTFVSVGLSQPLGLIFEEAANRLLVCSLTRNQDIQAVSLPDGVVTSLVYHNLGGLDGITKDAAGNYYVTTVAGDPPPTSNEIFRYDSAFTDPPLLIVDSLNGLVDAVYNRREKELAYVVSYINELGTVEMEIAFVADTTIGWVPLDIEFSGTSEYDIATWLWDFGDGTSGNGRTVTHIYDSPGLYDVTLQGITAANDTLQRFKQWFIAALADSLYADSVEIGSGDTLVELLVYVRTTTPLTELTIPIEYGGDIDLSYDSHALTAPAAECFDEAKMMHFDPTNKRITLKLNNTTGRPPLMPGLWPVLRLSFEPVGVATPGDQTIVTFDGYSGRLPAFCCIFFGTYIPITVGSNVLFIDCCQLRGDIDHNAVIDISDITAFVEYFFAAGDHPYCQKESDTDDDDAIKISDLMFLVEYLFGGGPPPADC